MILDQSLDRLIVCAPQRHAHLALFPLLTRAPKAPAYRVLDEALAAGEVRVTELPNGGQVPELLLINRGTWPVLVLDGEELVGAKQNRVVNLTILAPPQSELIIPVSCVEQGRWHAASDAFTSASHLHFHAGRAAKVQSVSYAMATDRGPRADQGLVWDHVAEKGDRLGVDSPTQAMADFYTHMGSHIEEYVTAFSPQPDQAGALFALGGRVVGLEVFDSPVAFAKLLPKLIRSYALDAVEISGSESPLPTSDAAAAFLRQVATVEVTTFQGIGMGQAIRLRGPNVAGAGLVVEEVVVHLAAFRQENRGSRDDGQRTGRMRRASRRFV